MVESISCDIPLPSPEQVLTYVQGFGDSSPVLTAPAQEGHHSKIYICQNGPEVFPDTFIIRHSRKSGGCDEIERQYRQLDHLDGDMAPRALHFDRPQSLGGLAIAFEEFIPGEAKDLNTASEDETRRLARAIVQIHSHPSAQYSKRSGTPADTSGTYADYLRAMLDESVTQRLASVDLSSYPAAERLFKAGFKKFGRMVTSSLYQGSKFTRLHHDLSWPNILFGPNGIVCIDWNHTNGDPADDVAYILDDNRTSQKFRSTFLDEYVDTNPRGGAIVERIGACSLKNAQDDYAWAIAMCEHHQACPHAEQYADARIEREDILDNLLSIL